jgi:AbrB family looped-hinge helix DNA binding protein
MSNLATTKMSSKGQVVIPEEIRERLDLKEGTQFIVIGQGDSVILKSIVPPAMNQFKDLLSLARKEAKKVNFKKSDLEDIIKTTRKNKK